VVQEKLSHEKEVQRKAETEKKDVELRDKILYAFLGHVSCIVSCVSCLTQSATFQAPQEVIG
jgi:hypothetical protein